MCEPLVDILICIQLEKHVSKMQTVKLKFKIKKKNSSTDVTLQWLSYEVTLGSILLRIKVTYNCYIYLHKPKISYTYFFFWTRE